MTEHAAGSPREQLLDRVLACFLTEGVGDTSLRTLAAAIGTSHRMLNYHFGSREGLLAAVVERVEQGERSVLGALLDENSDPYEAGAAFWTHVADSATTFGPLFFELSAAAMQGKEFAAGLRRWLGTGWLAPLAAGFERAGHSADEAADLARLSLATARGLVFDLAVTGDRAAVDTAMARFTSLTRREVPSRSPA